MAYILSLLEALLYGLVMGITYWLPIAPDAHLALMRLFLPMRIFDDYLSNQAFWSMFRCLLQVSAALAVLLLFSGRLDPFQKGLRPQRKRQIERLWVLMIMTVLPAGVIAAVISETISTTLMSGWALAISMILFGLVMVWAEMKEKTVRIENVNQMKPEDAVKLSLFRFLALLPGIGDSASTLTGGELTGMNRSTAAEYTILLAVPTALGTLVYNVIRFLISGAAFSWFALFVSLFAMAVCFVTSLFVIRFLQRYVRRHDLKIFGLYRVMLGVLILIFALFKVI